MTRDEVLEVIKSLLLEQRSYQTLDQQAGKLLAALEAKGMAVVEREPTDKMIFRGASTLDHPSVFMGGPSQGNRRNAARVWKAMLAAAAPAEGKDG